MKGNLNEIKESGLQERIRGLVTARGSYKILSGSGIPVYLRHNSEMGVQLNLALMEEQAYGLDGNFRIIIEVMARERQMAFAYSYKLEKIADSGQFEAAYLIIEKKLGL